MAKEACHLTTVSVRMSVAQTWLQAGKSGGGHCFRGMWRHQWNCSEGSGGQPPKILHDFICFLDRGSLFH